MDKAELKQTLRDLKENDTLTDEQRTAREDAAWDAFDKAPQARNIPEQKTPDIIAGEFSNKKKAYLDYEKEIYANKDLTAFEKKNALRPAWQKLKREQSAGFETLDEIEAKEVQALEDQAFSHGKLSDAFRQKAQDAIHWDSGRRQKALKMAKRLGDQETAAAIAYAAHQERDTTVLESWLEGVGEKQQVAYDNLRRAWRTKDNGRRDRLHATMIMPRDPG